ncbi:MAG: rhomboid family intramembrane serine protease [Chloracidobacterium sp.]|nr:rhomboid family intramembrane serine protease [Chloracidobacterium sp.]MCO5333343.1 rhomboid family intramembrane serine protease [Pyrinomonadaceae bacterium]
MFPLGDDNSDRRTQPVVNYTIIGLNVLVFLIFQRLGGNDAFTYAFSLVPREIVTGIDLQSAIRITDATGRMLGEIPQYPTPLPVYFNFLSSMFMHGSIMHLAGNMLFLFIFGDNLEDLLGHFRYLFFYLVCGFAAAGAQMALDPNSVIPMLGASGAISGVLAGYLLMFPKRSVKALVFNVIMNVPAFVAIGIWILYQVVLGYFTPSDSGGVAYAAHIGGFVAGLLLVKIFALGRRSRSYQR